MVTKHINVTQEHIDKGVPEEGDNCPVYRAIDEVCKSILHVGYEQSLFVGPEGKDIKVWMPEEVNMRITSFDNGDGMEPFEFDLDIPDNVKCD